MHLPFILKKILIYRPPSKNSNSEELETPGQTFLFTSLRSHACMHQTRKLRMSLLLAIDEMPDLARCRSICPHDRRLFCFPSIALSHFFRPPARCASLVFLPSDGFLFRFFFSTSFIFEFPDQQYYLTKGTSRFRKHAFMEEAFLL
ncbi:unnamed protein product [Ixodes pacificus]